MEFIWCLYIAVLSALQCKKGHKNIIKHKLTYDPTVHIGKFIDTLIIHTQVYIKERSELKEGSVWSTNVKLLLLFFYDYSYSSTFQQSSSSQVKTEAPLISILSPQSVCPQQPPTCFLF